MDEAFTVATILVDHEREVTAGRDLDSLCARERVARFAMSKLIAEDLAPADTS